MEALAVIHTCDKLLQENLPPHEIKTLGEVLNNAAASYRKNGDPVLFLPYRNESVSQFFHAPQRAHMKRVDTSPKKPPFTLLSFQHLMTRVKLAELCRGFPTDIHITVGGVSRILCVQGICREFNTPPKLEDIQLFKDFHPEISPIQLKAALQLRIHATQNDALCNQGNFFRGNTLH